MLIKKVKIPHQMGEERFPITKPSLQVIGLCLQTKHSRLAAGLGMHEAEVLTRLLLYNIMPHSMTIFRHLAINHLVGEAIKLTLEVSIAQEVM